MKHFSRVCVQLVHRSPGRLLVLNIIHHSHIYIKSTTLHFIEKNYDRRVTVSKRDCGVPRGLYIYNASNAATSVAEARADVFFILGIT